MKYCINFENIACALAAMLSNPELKVSAKHSEDYNGCSKIYLEDGFLKEEIFGRSADGDYAFMDVPIRVVDRACCVDGYYEENFFFIMSYLTLNSIRNIRDLYEFSKLNNNHESLEFCKSEWHNYLSDMVWKSEELDNTEKGYLDTVFDNM